MPTRGTPPADAAADSTADAAAGSPALVRPLAGVRVVDLSRLLPGPYCSLLLADLGADVVKVETPTAGDYARMAPPELGFGGVFEAVNRGKRSVAVNYRLPRGREVVLALARRADVFLESSRPGQLARHGLADADVRAVNPSVVYCSISGYGQTGPYRDRPGHDLDYLAVAGLLPLLAPEGGRPAPPGIQIADLAGGTLAALEIVSALFRRARTGQGAFLDVAILDAVVAWLGPLGEAVRGGDPRPPAAGPTAARPMSARRTATRPTSTAGQAVRGPLGGAFPCYAVYAAADGEWLAVGALEPPFWVELCSTLGREDLVPRQFDPTARPEVAALLAERPAAEWLALLGESACVAPVNLPVGVAHDPQVRARGMVMGADGDEHLVTPLRAIAHDGDGGPAPGLGDHTREVLAEAGIPIGEVAALEADGVIAGPSTPERRARAARLASLLARMAQRERVGADR